MRSGKLRSHQVLLARAIAPTCFIGVSVIVAACFSGCGLEEGGFGAAPAPGDDGGQGGGGPDSEAPLRTIGGTVTGLLGHGLTLQNNGGDDLVISEDGDFVFKAKVPAGEPYSVHVAAHPTESYQECKVVRGEGQAGSKNVLDIEVACALHRSCKGLHAGFPALPSATYLIGPNEDSDAIAYCDMAYDGGGWTLIEATSQLAGPDDLTAASSKEEIAPGKKKYMSPERMKAVAANSSQVHIRESGKPENAITSTRDSLPIVNLRQGRLVNSGLNGKPAEDQKAPWTGVFAVDGVLVFQCAPDGGYPGIYSACGNQTGMHLAGGLSVWNRQGDSPNKNLAMDVFIR